MSILLSGTDKRYTNQQGTVLIEASFVLSLLALIGFSGLNLGMYLHYSSVAQNLARVVAKSTSLECGTIQDETDYQTCVNNNLKAAEQYLVYNGFDVNNESGLIINSLVRLPDDSLKIRYSKSSSLKLLPYAKYNDVLNAAGPDFERVRSIVRKLDRLSSIEVLFIQPIGPIRIPIRQAAFY
jgi:hypothetical protein